MKKFLAVLFLVFLSFSLKAETMRSRRVRRTPGFVTACTGLELGASCTFTARRTGKTYTGVCKEIKSPRGVNEVICHSDELLKDMPQRPPRPARAR